MTKLMLTIGVYCTTPAVTHYINQSKNTLLINYAAKYVRACKHTFYFYVESLSFLFLFLLILTFVYFQLAIILVF